MITAGNVYPSREERFPSSLFGRPTRRSYRAAIKQIVLSVMGQHGLNAEELAERIGVGEDTIKNAAKEANSLEAVTLLSIAYEFGEDAIEPVRSLYLCAPARGETNTEKRKRLIRELAALEDE